MHPIENFQIHQFRGIQDLKLERLGQFNLLVGENNSGKTSVLEAIELHCHPLDLLRFVAISKKRDAEAVHLPTLDSLKWMFPAGKQGKDLHQEIGEILLSSESGTLRAKSLIAYKETKVMEMVGEKSLWSVQEAFLKEQLLKEQLLKEQYWIKQTWKENAAQKSQVERVEEEKSDYQANLLKWQNRFDDFYSFTTHFPKPSEKEVQAFDIHFSYTASDQDSQDHPNVWNDEITVTNVSMIKQGEHQYLSTSTGFVSPTDHRLLPINSEAISQAILSGDQLRVVALLQLFDPDIENLQILAPDGSTPVPYLMHKLLGLAPVSVFGDGIRKALTLASAVVKCRDGILLLDEIDTAVHVRALDKVFAWLVKACKQYNVQVFATTHSLEAIDAILAVFLESEEVQENREEWQAILQDFVTYRIVNKGKTTITKRFSGADLADIRYDFGQDVR